MVRTRKGREGKGKGNVERKWKEIWNGKKIGFVEWRRNVGWQSRNEGRRGRKAKERKGKENEIKGKEGKRKKG